MIKQCATRDYPETDAYGLKILVLSFDRALRDLFTDQRSAFDAQRRPSALTKSLLLS